MNVCCVLALSLCVRHHLTAFLQAGNGPHCPSSPSHCPCRQSRIQHRVSTVPGAYSSGDWASRTSICDTVSSTTYLCHSHICLRASKWLPVVTSSSRSQASQQSLANSVISLAQSPRRDLASSNEPSTDVTPIFFASSSAFLKLSFLAGLPTRDIFGFLLVMSSMISWTIFMSSSVTSGCSALISA